MLSLDLSKKDYPWNLITNPTLLPNPIAPRKRAYFPYGVLLGAFIGIIYSFYIYKKENLLLDVDQLENTFSYPVLDEISKINIQDIIKSVEFVSSSPSIKNLNNIGILVDEDIDQKNLIKLKNSFKEASFNKMITFFSDFRSISKPYPQIIIVEIGSTKINNLLNLIKRMISNDVKILGFIAIKWKLRHDIKYKRIIQKEIIHKYEIKFFYKKIY